MQVPKKEHMKVGGGIQVCMRYAGMYEVRTQVCMRYADMYMRHAGMYEVSRYV